MKKIFPILPAVLSLLMAACSSDDGLTDDQTIPKTGTLTISTSVNSFEGEGGTRTTLAGNAFATGDWIKLKIICPYVSNTLIGETTWGNSADALWLLKWSGSAWIKLDASSTGDKVDVSSHYSYGNNEVFGQYEAQQTPYIYTASTWNENVIFLAPNTANGSSMTRYSQYSYIFHADQSLEADYLKNDLLWAQTYMQTGSYDVHLSFNHVMACLKVTISGGSLSTDAVVTLEGMPDIDQKEVVVGDYYAAASKVNTKYGYQDKCTCSKENNGKVLGVAVITESSAKAVVYPMTGNPNPNSLSTIANTGVYTAHYNDGSYYLIVPPCTLSANATFMIRDGAKRYRCTLSRTGFEQGKLYPVNISL